MLPPRRCVINHPTPDTIPESLQPPGVFTQIAAGEWHTCGLRPDGDADCWGQDTIGTNRWDELTTPWATRHAVSWKDARPAPPPDPYTALAAGNFHTCAIRDDRTIDCWGG